MCNFSASTTQWKFINNLVWKTFCFKTGFQNTSPVFHWFLQADIPAPNCLFHRATFGRKNLYILRWDRRKYLNLKNYKGPSPLTIYSGYKETKLQQYVHFKNVLFLNIWNRYLKNACLFRTCLDGHASLLDDLYFPVLNLRTLTVYKERHLWEETLFIASSLLKSTHRQSQTYSQGVELLFE